MLGLPFDVYALRIVAEKALLKSEKLALVGLLSGVLSHEIRNPLDSINNLLYLAADENDLAILHDYVRIAKGELDRISNIVTHTLQFNRQSDNPAPDRLSAILDSAVAVYEFRIRHSGVKLHRDYARLIDTPKGVGPNFGTEPGERSKLMLAMKCAEKCPEVMRG